LWKRQNGATLTFLTTKNQLKSEKFYFKTFSKWSGDSSLWSGITLGWNYFGLLKNFFKFTWSEKRIIIQMSIFFLPQFVLNRKKNLYVATPSVGTHMETGLLAPNVDWNKEFNRCLKSPTQIYEKVNDAAKKISFFKKIKNIVEAFNIIKYPMAIIPLAWIVGCLLLLTMLFICFLG
jgi:hypothetical protein